MKKIINSLLLTIIGIVSSCTWLKDFGDTNINPATTSTPVTGALLPSVLSRFSISSRAGFYCQYFSETSYPDASLYSSNSSSPMDIYSGVLYDLQNIINTNSNDATKAAAEVYGANSNQIAIARILKAYILWGITNMWGDVPYSEALKDEPNVEYDTQESIYKDMISELTEAVAQFTSGRPITGDIAYNGDIAKWKKLANSLRMLMALNLSKRYPDASGYSATQFKAALADPSGSIENNSDIFMLNYPGGELYLNPFYGFNRWNDHGESATLVSLLVDSLGSDLRQNAFGADRNCNPSALGVPYGRDRATSDQWCQMHPDYCYVLACAFRGQAGPYFIINASSVLLARAEAADRGWTTEKTSSLYQQGITASFTQWGLEAPDADYFTKTKVALGAAGKNLKQIAIQQYLAYYPDGLQGWNTWRRTGWPVLFPAPDAINSPKVIPRRFMYGQFDYSLTAQGIAKAVTRLGTNGDKMDSRVWWDKE
jgi:hypothetical protein